MTVSTNSSSLASPHVLGVVATLNIESTTIFICIAVVSLILIGAGVDYVMIWAKLHQYEAIIFSLIRQATILGSMSLLVFVFECLTRSNEELNDALLSFKFMNAIMLFLFLGFVTQALQLISVCINLQPLTNTQHSPLN